MEIIPKKGKNVFYCALHPNYSLWDGTKFLQFREGVIQTDAAGAAAIRKHPMFGRLFTEKPPLPEVDRHPELKMADLITLPMDSYDCPECEETFASRMALQMHHDETHAGKEVTTNE